MRRILIFILPVLIIMSVGLGIFGIFQVRFEQEKLIEDLQRKASAVAESMDLSARHILDTNDLRNANRLVEKFQKRERLQGCAIYDSSGNIFAITNRFADWRNKEKPYIEDILKTRASRGSIEEFKNYTVYSYIMPLVGDDGAVEGLIEIIYDTSYVLKQVAELWQRLSITLIALAILTVLIALFVQKQIFVSPVERLTEWFKYFQRGEIDSRHPIKEKGELGKLASEVEQVALGLRVARRVVSEDALQRIKKNKFWTEARLRDLVQAKLGENALIVVSNREPYMHIMDEALGAPKCVRPPSGVTTALDPILKSCGGLWVAHGSGNADKKFVNSKNKLGVPPSDERYILKRVWLNKREEDGYYYGFANEGLWPLCHITYTRPVFRESDWQTYKSVNEKFAQAIIEEMPSKNPFVFIQDYHFTLLPKMIKEKRPDATVALFWHIPWPNPEIFSICPYQKEILDGMLGCDLIGFHVRYHCNNFLDTVNRLLECRVDTEKLSVIRLEKETIVRPFPISIDTGIYSKTLDADRRDVEKIKKEYDLDGKVVGIGVDRIDYTKGLVERIHAIDRFFEKYPDYKNRFTFIQLAAPSRTHIKRYHDLVSEIDGLVESVNWKHSDGSWQPIIYLKKHFSADEIRPFYKLGDLCIISSLHDGMNLVSKEYIAAKENQDGIIIISCFTGASRELTDAIIVNPYAIEEFADSIKAALDMPEEEKAKRMANMQKLISENNVYRWAGKIITELTSLQKGA